MRILLFVSQLWNLTGGEINTRDWAFGLKARGHKITVYTPLPGPLAETVRNAGIALVDDPALIHTAPDVMFGSGINEIVTLMTRFPEVPAVQIAQQWNSWTAFPVLLPQVMLYMAVDEINHEMLVNECGVAPEKVTVVHNSVDLDRIPPRRRPLPPRPERALMFVKADAPLPFAKQGPPKLTARRSTPGGVAGAPSALKEHGPFCAFATSVSHIRHCRPPGKFAVSGPGMHTNEKLAVAAAWPPASWHDLRSR